MDKLINYLLSAIPLGMTFLYGSTGEIITEKAGHLNLGIPGIMCVGAAGGCLALQLMSVNAALPGVLVVLIALLASFFCAAMMGLIYSFLTVSLHANQNVTGLALTTFGVGTMKFIMSKITVMAAETETRYLYAIKYFRFPFADSTTFKYCGIMVFLAIAIAIVTSYVLNRTRVGLHLRAVGENPATADAMSGEGNMIKDEAISQNEVPNFVNAKLVQALADANKALSAANETILQQQEIIAKHTSTGIYTPPHFAESEAKHSLSPVDKE